MSYATKQDIDLLYGEELLKRIADRDLDGEADDELVERAVEEADAEINAYLELRYDLPLTVVPVMLRRIASNVAIYHVCLSDDVRTAEIRQRYEDAIAFLEKVAKGQVGLGLPPDGTDPMEPVEPAITLSTGRLTRG